MSKSWSALRKQLEQDYLAPALRGRVQYFCTNYHGAPDNYGRLSVRVDGKEVLQANPYNELAIHRIEQELKAKENIPMREWHKNGFLYDAENAAAEEDALQIAMEQGIMEDFTVLHDMESYCSVSVQDAIRSGKRIWQMLAVLDRRTGKRTLAAVRDEMENGPEWLRFFYHLRLEAENIK